MTEIKKRGRPAKKVDQAENTFRVSATVDLTKSVKKEITPNLTYDACSSLKPNDKVKIIKDGKDGKDGTFWDLEGEIISITEGLGLPFLINLKEFGVWSFKREDFKIA